MERPCSFDDCPNDTKGRPWCSGHYRQRAKGVPLRPLAKRQKNKGLTCSGPECGRPAYANGLCSSHHVQLHRSGEELYPLGSRANVPRKYAGIGCRFDGCDRGAKAEGLCHAHSMQMRRSGELTPIGWRPAKPPRECTQDGCDLAASKRGLCNTHYRQHWRYGVTKPIRTSSGRRVDSNGYVYVKRPDSPEARDSGWGAEHRIVMAEHLGRPLQKDESVHHKNGDREDNQLKNLELWSRWQPPGQRVADKVAYAKELLARYEPEALTS